MNPQQQPLENIQILELHKQGATVEQIAEALNKDPKIIGYIIKAEVDKRRKLSLEERFGDLKLIAISALKEVCQSSTSDSARVQAAKILNDEVEGNNTNGSLLGGFNYSELAERLLLAEKQVAETPKHTDIRTDSASGAQDVKQEVSKSKKEDENGEILTPIFKVVNN